MSIADRLLSERKTTHCTVGDRVNGAKGGKGEKTKTVLQNYANEKYCHFSSDVGAPHSFTHSVSQSVTHTFIQSFAQSLLTARLAATEAEAKG